MTLSATSPSALSVSPGATPVRIGLLGLGTVGRGVYKLLSRHEALLVTRAAVRHPDKPRPLDPPLTVPLTTDPLAVARADDVDLVVEVMGGLTEAYEAIRTALTHGKHVVTANKVVIAAHGPELFALAREKGVNLLFEAAVAGGIPIILPLKTSLAGNALQRVAGILNGTTNYILTRMEAGGLDFAQALHEAQDKGFAEADPTADVDGLDAACKISILASIAYQQAIPQTAVYTEGISRIGAEDIAMAETLGFAIRLIALAQKAADGRIDVRVHPMLVPKAHPLAAIRFENNAVWVVGDAVGEVMFYGRGAGELPTASAVTGDILMIARTLQTGQTVIPSLQLPALSEGRVFPMAETVNAYYVRIETEDQSGVIGQLGLACGEQAVSLNAVMQKGIHPETRTATIVLLTHAVSEAAMQAALKTIAAQPATRRIHTVLRVFAS